MISEIRHPQILRHSALKPWFFWTVSKLVPGPARMEEVSNYIADLCGQEHTQVLLGIEEGRPVALLVSQLPTPLMLQPTILFAYNEGSKEIGAEMVEEAARWMRAAGFSHFLFTNRSGRSDAAYERVLRPHGKVVERATTFLVELRKEEQEDGVEVRRGRGLGVPAA